MSNTEIYNEYGSNIKSTKRRSTKSSIKRNTRKINDQIALQRITKVLQRHLLNNMNNICSDSGECMALGGKGKTAIRKYFNGFTDFNYVEPPIQSIGNESGNGFVKQITYTRNKYSAYAILKSSKNTTSDNLAYEFAVGQYINKLCNRFPCFLETYGLYYYDEDSSWEYMKNNEVKDVNFLKEKLIGKKTSGYDIDYISACKNSNYASILLENVNSAVTLYDIIIPLMETYTDIDGKTSYNYNNLKPFAQDELPFILFQIYFALSILSETFTHYDLHINNVLIYTLDSNKYLQYHYHYKDGKTVSFKSKYIAKIIDYGRSFFNDEEAKMDSKKIRASLCVEPSCNPKWEGECGKFQGFASLRGLSNESSELNESNGYIDSTNANYSHDLLLIHQLKNILMKKIFNGSGIFKLFRNLNYNSDFGTVAMKTDIEPKMSKKPKKRNEITILDFNINNVNDLSRQLKYLIVNNFGKIMGTNESNYSLYKTIDENVKIMYTKIGDLHIYEDGTHMKYIPNSY
jgi:hypothetical protein